MNSERTALLFAVFLGATAGSFAATPWEDYLTQPSPGRAAKVQEWTYSVTPKDPASVELDLMLFELQVLARDPEAVRLAFRLRKKQDGHIAEMLDIMLGRLIRIDAPLFLRELQRAAPVTRPDSLVSNLGPEYVDRSSAQSYEISRRIEALRAVSDPRLREVRGWCIEELNRQQSVVSNSRVDPPGRAPLRHGPR